MKLKRLAMFLIALVLMFRSHSVYAQAGISSIMVNPEALQEKLLEDLVSTNARERCDAAVKLEGQRVQLMSNLLVILNSPIPDDRKMDTAATFEDLVSTNARVRLETAIQIERQQQQMLDKLAILLNSPIPDDRKMHAAAILGVNHSELAILYLVNHLEWQINLTNPAAYSAYYGDAFPRLNLSLSRRDLDLAGLISTTPVTGSLARIGVGAIPALMDRISQSDNEQIIEECVNTCIVIEGYGNVGAEVTQLRLQDRLQKEMDPKKKVRFQTALDLLKKIWPPF